eukprot:TRINITY_DN11370_c0_g1::TRINITY_DN11370_c0_g1_i1::g.26368::m.26368 TRINITY_DN11370_c0_g1::TRINITY_DN11370_c0_g1_i1::g.26368  ORF type:complete len:110 (+),score=21.00,sp/Q2HJH9/PDCD5_BOVIN/42.42/6e-16,dsDNA_bind/PF01984.15/8.5e-24 TRINITY_DN11370_c0_g1_i1:90-419(+)
MAEDMSKYQKSANAAAEAEERRQQAEAQRQMMLGRLLDVDARARLARIAIARPDRARAVEDMILNQARMGAIRTMITESQLIDLLEKGTQSEKKTTVIFDRRRSALDDD